MRYTKSFLEESLMLKQRLVYSGANVVYHGYAEPGTMKTDAGWLIVKYTYDNNDYLIGTDFADGSKAFNKIMEEYAGYEYI